MSTLGDVRFTAAATLERIIRFDDHTEGSFYPYLLDPLLGVDATADPDGALGICRSIERNRCSRS